jgi:hypothetical protein
MSTFENYTSSLELALKIILPELDYQVLDYQVKVRVPGVDNSFRGAPTLPQSFDCCGAGWYSTAQTLVILTFIVITQ